jgi:acyl carrier protein
LYAIQPFRQLAKTCRRQLEADFVVELADLPRTDPGEMDMTDFERLRRVLRDTLNLGPRADNLSEDSRLLGGLPELDSMAVLTVLAAIENEYEIRISAEELSADLFQTAGTLNQFLSKKVDGRGGAMAGT